MIASGAHAGEEYELHVQGFNGLERDRGFAAGIAYNSRLAPKRDSVASKAEFNCSSSPARRHLEEEALTETCADRIERNCDLSARIAISNGSQDGAGGSVFCRQRSGRRN